MGEFGQEMTVDVQCAQICLIFLHVFGSRKRQIACALVKFDWLFTLVIKWPRNLISNCKSLHFSLEVL